MDKIFIYGLVDPRTDQVRYIGKSASPEGRLRQHLTCGDGSTAKSDWIHELRSEGLIPMLRILDETDREHWATVERQWIAEARRAGWDLFNPISQALQQVSDSVPTQADSLTWDQFVDIARNVKETTGCSLALGRLIDIGIERFRQEDESESQFKARCARALGCVRVTLTKALVVYRCPVDVPKGLEPTKAYEIISGEDDPDKLEEALFRAVSEGWRVEDIREMKMLHEEGLLDDWRRLRLTLGEDGSIFVSTSDSQTRCFGKIDQESQDRMIRAAIAVLQRRAMP